MAKRGGFPGGGIPGNMNNLMKQAQRMQRQMEEGQKELESKEFVAKTGGGAVEVAVNGKKEVLRIQLSEEIVDPDDIETLQDAVLAAVNEAMRQAEEASNEVMGTVKGEGNYPAGAKINIMAINSVLLLVINTIINVTGIIIHNACVIIFDACLLVLYSSCICIISNFFLIFST